MARTIVRTAQAGTGAPNRQDVRGFATTASPTSTDPIALGYTACDVDGLELMGRTVHASTADTATGTHSQALAAYAKRARLMLQNLSEDTILEYTFGATATAGQCFRLFPGSVLTIDGDAVPADQVRVVTATGSAAYLAMDW